MTEYTVTIYVKVGGDLFCPYRTGERLAEVDDFLVRAESGRAARAVVSRVGNKISSAEISAQCDKLYPLDVRSLSVGDVIRVRRAFVKDFESWYACDPIGWRLIKPPAEEVFVPLAGTNATSREA